MAPKQKLQKNKKASIKLPAQIWLLILSHLSYFDLKRAQRVNKAFNRLIASPYFDAQLFRSQPSPSSPLSPTTQVVLHPVFASLDLVTDRISDIFLHSGKGVEIKMLAVHALKFAREEMVTYPSSHEVLLEGLGHAGGQVYNDKGHGVTIVQLLETVVNCWNDPSDEYDEDEEAAMYEQDCEPEMTELTMYQALMQRNDMAEFAGWQRPLVNKDGAVVLTAEEIY